MLGKIRLQNNMSVIFTFLVGIYFSDSDVKWTVGGNVVLFAWVYTQ